jgi:ATP-dependent Clp protease ATP-binding subunit ClpA
MIPLVSADMISRLNRLGEFLRSNLIGQEEVIEAIAGLVQRSCCQMRYDGQPVASTLLLGPTGTGKTNLVELVNEHLFCDASKLIRLDMSEYQNQSSLERLIGSGARGLFGRYFDQSGGYGTLLFDEIEKAAQPVLDILLQILSAGRFTGGDGETLDLTRFIVFATSNIGSRVLMASHADRETIVERTETAVESDMRPEIVGRFDLIASFNKLDHQSMEAIACLHMERCLDLINAKGHELRVSDGVLGYVQRQGYSEKFGARPIRNAAMRILGGAVAGAMLVNGGLPVRGVIEYDRRANKVALV